MIMAPLLTHMVVVGTNKFSPDTEVLFSVLPWHNYFSDLHLNLFIHDM